MVGLCMYVCMYVLDLVCMYGWFMYVWLVYVCMYGCMYEIRDRQDLYVCMRFGTAKTQLRALVSTASGHVFWLLC